MLLQVLHSMLPSSRRLVFPGPQLGALVNQAKTDPISETCAGKKSECMLWFQVCRSTNRGMEEPLACLGTRFAADAGVQLAACWYFAELMHSWVLWMMLWWVC